MCTGMNSASAHTPPVCARRNETRTAMKYWLAGLYRLKCTSTTRVRGSTYPASRSSSIVLRHTVRLTLPGTSTWKRGRPSARLAFG